MKHFLLGLLLLGLAGSLRAATADDDARKALSEPEPDPQVITILQANIIDFLGSTTASVPCPPVGKARAYYDPVVDQFFVIDNLCHVIIGGSSGTTTLRLDQITDPNVSKTFNLGGTTLSLTGGTFDLSNLTGFVLPTVSGNCGTAGLQVCVDPVNNNVIFWHGSSSGVVALFDSGTTYADGNLVGISLVNGHYALTSVVPNTGGGGGGGTPVTAQITNIQEGDSICWDSGIPMFVNCSAGIPINLQTGSSYTYDAVNDRGTAVIANGTGAQTYTLGQIGDATAFDDDWFVFQLVKRGILTVNTTTSVFDDTNTSSEVLLQGQQCTFITDPAGNGTIYPKCHEPRIIPGTGISISRSPYAITLTASPSAPVSNGLISGGGVSWTSGLTFEVSAASYSIAGTSYSTAETSKTLTAADPTNPRVDVLAVDSAGTVVVITGTPSPDPAKPSVDPTSQLELTHVQVNANASTPVVTQTVLYRNNAGSPTEFNCTNTSNINCNSTNNPFGSYTHSIEATTAVNGNNAVLTVGTGTVNLATSDTFVFFIRNKATPWPNPKTIQIFWRNGTTVVGTAVSFKNGVYGFDQTNTASYQQIAIPTTAFQTGVAPVTNVVFQVTGGGGSIGFYLGNVLLQSGFSGGGGSGGGGSFTLQANSTPQQSTVNLADNASVTWACTTSAGISTCQATAVGAPPSGAAGGDLAGTFPNPTVNQIQGAAIPLSAALVGTNASRQLIVGHVNHALSFSIGDPNGAALTTGSTITDYISVPFACTINRYTLQIDAGTITVKFWKVALGTAIPTSGNSINTSGVSISSGTAITSTTLSDFTTTSVAANDALAMNVTAVSTAKFVNGVLSCQE